MSAKFSSLDRNNLINKYVKGTTISELCREFSTSFCTVRNILKDAGKYRLTIRGRKKLDESEVVISYQNGNTISEIATKFGVYDKTISSILHDHGVHVVNRIYLKTFDINRAVEMYSNGIGLGGISQEFGCCRTAIRKRLEKVGVHIRNASEQQQARMDNASPETKNALLKKAHIAARGRVRSAEELAKGARAREHNKSTQSQAELRLIKMLAERGFPCCPQKQVGPYNCDIAIAPVAVEVLGGQWHWYGEHRARAQKRTYYFLNHGWHVLYIPVSKSSPLTDAVADYIANFINFARSNPAIEREYRVVWRAGEIVTRGCLNEDNFSFDPPFTNRRNPATGRYERIPRNTVAV